MSFEPCTDEYLTRLWEHIDWKAAEEKLADLQYQLTRAAYRKDGAAIEELQNAIVRDLNILESVLKLNTCVQNANVVN